MIRLPVESGGEAEELWIILAKDKTSIGASGPGVNLQFDLHAGTDGVVFLKHGGQPISSADAAVKILDHFIFPDLPRKY